jgi:5-methylthioadenosine/S-adenosylhomocysteine deaminase
MQVHCAAFISQVESHRALFGLSEVERLGEIGVLGPNVLLVHMGWITPKELLLLKKHDVRVVACPSPSFHSGYGSMTYGKFPEMRELGITVGLGSDAAPFSNFLDIVRNMYLFSGGLTEARLDPTVMPAEYAFEAATINGARTALWDAEIGSLEPHKKADVSIFDLHHPAIMPLHSPVANLVYCANGSFADTVIVNGEVLMENKKMLKIDEGEVLHEAQKRAEAIVKRAGLTGLVKPRWPVVE